MNSKENLEEFFIRQLHTWQLAASNYNDLQSSMIKRVEVDGAMIDVMLNPSRIKSTTANVSPDAVRRRECFLCADNRPAEQMAYPGFDDPDFEFLVNPYPICSPHFTIVSREHRPQDSAPWASMLRAAELFTSLLLFYNGMNAGASAPDHLHFQGVKQSELPLVNIINAMELRENELICSKSLDVKYPAEFHLFYGDAERVADLFLSDIRAAEFAASPLVNIFLWNRDGKFVVLIIPRAKHRPACYFADDESRMMISPGALDVAGRVVTVRLSDYERVDGEILKKIFEETCL
jgi:hypothetical protein